jgi:hypothetical protein
MVAIPAAGGGAFLNRTFRLTRRSLAAGQREGSIMKTQVFPRKRRTPTTKITKLRRRIRLDDILEDFSEAEWDPTLGGDERQPSLNDGT